MDGLLEVRLYFLLFVTVIIALALVARAFIDHEADKIKRKRKYR